jgi:hypothetical protein
LWRVSDAGRLRDGTAHSAADVRKPAREETALRESKNGAASAMGIWARRTSSLIGIEAIYMRRRNGLIASSVIGMLLF